MPEGVRTTVLMDREDQLIERVRRKLPSTAQNLRIGIGDDAAVLRAGGRAELVITTDAFLENVHFLRRVHPPKSVGYKALARATSDLAAMGARPRYFLLTLALPPDCTGKWLNEFLVGMALAARQSGLILVGGDTTKYPLIMASLTVLGEVDPGRAILRSGARPGDLICVSGTLGEAELGLEVVRKRLHNKMQRRKETKKHLYPVPRLALGQWLADHRCATAMIDTSDGLSTDLNHLCNASGVGARVWAEKIPTVNVPSDLKQFNTNPMRLALHGGEDYELLFTVQKRLARLISPTVAGVPVAIIGEITRGKKVTLLDSRGREKLLQPGGWDPFRSRE
jgi:thiamine-monophosphate kinase